MAASSPDFAEPVFRFAPSPNGRLHLGHALSVLTNERLAHKLGGQLLLRIEDIDVTRCKPEFEAGIREDLAWLGLRFDGAVRRQSEHFERYAEVVGGLQARGLVYPCFCSRQVIKRAVGLRQAWPVDPDGAPLYPGTCRACDPAEAATRIAAGEPHVLRLAMDHAIATVGGAAGYVAFYEAGHERLVAVQPARWGDVVLARKEVPTSYHLSVVLDDALQGVTHVVRGRDLEAATDIHVVLQRLLGLPTPRYHFHPLLSDETGQKLAKSRLSESLADLRERGVTAGEIRAQLGFG
ncbi:tRNA glutamyl-Q(34) synthetase GluQRS [Bosea psychrotolerans]|uniref:Glutamyl-Q tRNA(Asp) synthetase n=1 Tax=Bosea psychrotolerans TaxID=1871628 RepID=A0A2S4LU88_9HYPH|nr:tRNA glutamyl-Q(34) synthetase GluQRS [Bosea psychrotolerans]POR46016.1 glutamyl-Q tRNA(Asp) synthetase [Bosea psychrotolerans]